ncbi:MAG: phenylalanine--tRNA ligase subunit alpha [Planctomycetes bacterium]|nr:phenylalanine--tRNA ligase subunit alpha [Planctomycetota bacterium]MCB9871101.1 phenylalanine--tRNA ligase subunit alpha [Planctomycetota bacterium]MCB9888261.1 phenylalanine--tRNA ligase subunit alpha [Planctomycetota bacterium]
MDNRRQEWLDAIAAAGDEAELRRIDHGLLGKQGVVQELVRGVSSLPAAERPAAGKAANQLKLELQAALDARRAHLQAESLTRELAAPDFDPTEPGPALTQGTLHPITAVQNELVELFTSLGFTWQDGPEIESEHYNFEALNIPADHPARDVQDTFWLQDGTLLRTHTSPVQVRTMRRFRPPLRVIVPGRCFRQETVDASHEHTFFQMEGLVVDRAVSTANLIHTMKTCLRVILRREDLEVRLRPGFFPFVEPGFELDVRCLLCGGAGCKVCKQSGWIEILPCGMVHPNVLRAGGIDPEEYTGFAFGMGLQRVTMLRYGIPDIRYFMGGDLRFLRQFVEV